MYAGIAVFDAGAVRTALAGSGDLLRQLIPALILVFVLMSVIHMTLDGKAVKRHLGKGAGVRGWALAVAAGVLSLGPVYPWYALLADLRNRGMHPSLAATFLYARAIKLPLLPLMAHYFGLAYTVVLSLCLLVFSVISGWILGRLTAEA